VARRCSNGAQGSINQRSRVGHTILPGSLRGVVSTFLRQRRTDEWAASSSAPMLLPAFRLCSWARASGVGCSDAPARPFPLAIKLDGAHTDITAYLDCPPGSTTRTTHLAAQKRRR
jgi:hypothetical protein